MLYNFLFSFYYYWWLYFNKVMSCQVGGLGVVTVPKAGERENNSKEALGGIVLHSYD